MFLIVGLGNPGIKYENTRHNLGFKALDLIAGSETWENKYDSHFQKLEDIILAKPQTFMNNSGKSVAQIMKYYPDAQLILIHDELDLPLGSVKIMKNASAAGHNGVQSVIDEIGTQDFIRIRLGTNNPTIREQIPGEDYVLKDFTPEEEPLVAEMLKKTLDAVQVIQTQGLEMAQSKFNG